LSIWSAGLVSPRLRRRPGFGQSGGTLEQCLSYGWT